MTRILPIAALLTLVLSVAGLGDPPPKPQQPEDPPAAEKTKPPKVSPLMQMKLEHSKKILEGLALEDFDMIGSNARKLKLLSLEAGWKVIQTEEYATQSRDFRRACDVIDKAAKDKEVGRAALGYVALTVRCVECHSYMRQHKVDIAKSLSIGHGIAATK